MKFGARIAVGARIVGVVVLVVALGTDTRSPDRSVPKGDTSASLHSSGARQPVSWYAATVLTDGTGPFLRHPLIVSGTLNLAVCRDDVTLDPASVVVSVHESSREVAIGATARPVARAQLTATDCPALSATTIWNRVIELKAPLGTRRVLDASCGRARGASLAQHPAEPHRWKTLLSPSTTRLHRRRCGAAADW